MSETIRWLLEAGEPWTRFRSLVELVGRPEDDAEVCAARAGPFADKKAPPLG